MNVKFDKKCIWSLTRIGPARQFDVGDVVSLEVHSAKVAIRCGMATEVKEKMEKKTVKDKMDKSNPKNKSSKTKEKKGDE